MKKLSVINALIKIDCINLMQWNFMSSKKTISWRSKTFFGYERIRAWTTKFGINRIAGANATLKMSNLQEMTASRTRVTLFHGVHPFQSVCLVHAATTRTRGESRILHRKQITKTQLFDALRPSRLFASSSLTDVFLFVLPMIIYSSEKSTCLSTYT